MEFGFLTLQLKKERKKERKKEEKKEVRLWFKGVTSKNVNHFARALWVGLHRHTPTESTSDALTWETHHVPWTDDHKVTGWKETAKRD